MTSNKDNFDNNNSIDSSSANYLTSSPAQASHTQASHTQASHAQTSHAQTSHVQSSHAQSSHAQPSPPFSFIKGSAPSYPYRMMDANLNRVAEGLRVVEDVLRFTFEDDENCKFARQLRHDIRSLFRDYHSVFLAQRNVQKDPGVVISKVQVLDQKTSLPDLLLANIKRAQEGLRVLEESCHLLNQRNLAKEVEKIRFAAYELESKMSPYLHPANEHLTTTTPYFNTRAKDPSQKRANAKEFPSPELIFKTLNCKEAISMPAERPKLPAGIYALTSEPHSLGRSNIEVAKEILASGVKILQYREKNKKVKQMYEECLVLREMTREAGALFIVNDHIDIAVAVDADGVHVGQDDLPVKWVREIVGPKRIIGVSTHSPEQAQRAVADGADYIGVGPIYATKTKTDVCDPVGLEYLRYVVENLDIPFVAIGGIKEHNIADVLNAGAKTVALVTEIVGSPDIRGTIQRLHAIMNDEKLQ